MDDDNEVEANEAEELCRIAQFHEDGLRSLRKRLRRTGHHEASFLALEAADLALAAARALAPVMPPLYPRNGDSVQLRELHAAG